MANNSSGKGMTDIQRATKDWDPWLIVLTNPEIVSNTRKCVFCGWTSIFVRKRALAHFGYGPTTFGEKSKKILWVVLQKFKSCNRVVPKEMTFEEMEGEVSRPHGIDEGVLHPPLAAGVEQADDRSVTNEVVPPTPNFVGSTPTTAKRRMNTTTMSQ